MDLEPIFNKSRTKFYVPNGAVFGIPCYSVIQTTDNKIKGHFVCSVRDIETAEKWLKGEPLPEGFSITIDWDSFRDRP